MVLSPTAPSFASRLLRVLGAWLLVCALALGAASGASGATMQQRIDRAVTSHSYGTSTSVVVFNAGTGRVVYARGSNRSIIPASNQKLYTAAGVLHGLSANYRLRTFVALRGTQDGATFRGNVYLIGGGDPTLSTPVFSQRHYGGRSGKLLELVQAVKRRGIRRIEGQLVIDDSFLDRQRYVSSWRTGFRYDESEALGALTVNRSHHTLSMGGTSSREPDRFAGTLFRALMKDRGVTITGSTLLRRTTPRNAIVVGTTYAPPVRALVRYMNTYSDNFTAEILLKDLGALRGGAGTTARGAAVVRRRVELLGLPVDGLRIADGSGLSYSNRTTAAHISKLLQAVDRNPDISTWFRSSLAVNGSSGTLRRRLTDSPYRGRVRGKTGTLRMTSGVSGFATRLNGRRYGFAVLTYRSSGVGSPSHARALQDRIMRITIK